MLWQIIVIKFGGYGSFCRKKVKTFECLAIDDLIDPSLCYRESNLKKASKFNFEDRQPRGEHLLV